MKIFRLLKDAPVILGLILHTPDSNVTVSGNGVPDRWYSTRWKIGADVS